MLRLVEARRLAEPEREDEQLRQQLEQAENIAEVHQNPYASWGFQ